MDTFQLNILAASSVFYEGECESLVVPTPDGKRGVLAHHSNAIAAISPGELSYTVPGEKPRLAAVSHGMIKIEDNHVLVLVETAEKPEDIDRIRNQQGFARRVRLLLIADAVDVLRLFRRLLFFGMVLPVVERTPPDVETLHYRQSVVHVEYM